PDGRRHPEDDRQPLLASRPDTRMEGLGAAGHVVGVDDVAHLRRSKKFSRIAIVEGDFARLEAELGQRVDRGDPPAAPLRAHQRDYSMRSEPLGERVHGGRPHEHRALTSDLCLVERVRLDQAAVQVEVLRDVRVSYTIMELRCYWYLTHPGSLRVRC